MFFAPIFWRGG